MEFILIYIFMWIGLCCFITFLYRIKAILFKEDSEISKSKFKAVYMSSMAGAIIGIWPFLISAPLLFFTFEFFFPNWEWDSNNFLLGWIDFKVSLIVIYLACVFVSGNMWLLSHKKIIIKKDENWDV